MTFSREYPYRVMDYLVHNYGDRGIEVYREVPLGKSTIGKERRLDLLILNTQVNRALGIECKWQQSGGTTDEKIPYALDDLDSMPMHGLLLYAGDGFSDGVKHMLACHPFAAYCLPNEELDRSPATREFDHHLAMAFDWWDVIVGRKVSHKLGARAAAKRPKSATSGQVDLGAALQRRLNSSDTDG